MDESTDSTQDPAPESEEPTGDPNDRAEWVALMCVLGKEDRDLFRELRREAWESVIRSGSRSTMSN